MKKLLGHTSERTTYEQCMRPLYQASTEYLIVNSYSSGSQNWLEVIWV